MDIDGENSTAPLGRYTNADIPSDTFDAVSLHPDQINDEQVTKGLGGMRIEQNSATSGRRATVQNESQLLEDSRFQHSLQGMVRHEFRTTKCSC